MEITLPFKTDQPWPTGLLACLDHAAEHCPGVTVWRERLPEIRDVPRWNQAALLRVNGKWVYLDCWDYDIPTKAVKIEQPFGKIELFVKIQSGVNTPQLCPWSMFHTAQMDWLANLERRRAVRAMSRPNHKWGFTGHIWNERKPWLDVLSGASGGILDVWSTRKRNGTTEDWIMKTHNWKVGVILRGKHGRMTEGKNRREVEFASLGLPMVLNYHPHYAEPFLPDVHYVYWDKPENFELAVDKAIAMSYNLAKNARGWWERTASIPGLCKSFVRLMQEKGIA